MSELHINKARFAKDEYNEEPVLYCKQCLSLRIKDVPGVSDTEYCDECNSTNIEQASIYEWERLYEQRYGHRFLEKPKY